MENGDIDPARKAILLRLLDKWKNICVERRADNNNSSDFRIGPAPADSPNLKKPIGKSTYGTLDSDVDDLQFSDDEQDLENHNEGRGRQHSPVKQSSEEGYSLASCRSLIMYFAKLGKGKNDKENIEMKFVDSMFSSGADVNFQDKHGQTIMHEIARAWHPNVMKFIIEKGGDINKADCFGRSPLHLAAAMDYADMVEFLIKNGGELHICCTNEWKFFHLGILVTNDGSIKVSRPKSTVDVIFHKYDSRHAAFLQCRKMPVLNILLHVISINVELTTY